MSDPSPFDGIIDREVELAQRTADAAIQAGLELEAEAERIRNLAAQTALYREQWDVGGSPPEFVFDQDNAQLCRQFVDAMARLDFQGAQPLFGPLPQTSRMRQRPARSRRHSSGPGDTGATDRHGPLVAYGYKIGYSPWRFYQAQNSRVNDLAENAERDILLCTDGLLRHQTPDGAIDMPLADNGTIMVPTIGNFGINGGIDEEFVGTTGRADNPVYRSVDNRTVAFTPVTLESVLRGITLSVARGHIQ